MDKTPSGLDAPKIASPCSVSWSDMKGDDRARDCSKCRLTVYNLSAMSRPEAEALIAQKEGRVCVRFFRRADGTVLTADCPVGLRAARLKLLRLTAAAAALVATVAAGLGLRRVHSIAAAPPLMGMISLPVETVGKPVQ